MRFSSHFTGNDIYLNTLCVYSLVTAPGVRRQAGRLAECLAEVGCVAEAREAGDGRELVRDYVPVRDPVTGGAALWDKVSEGYFRNSGKYQLAGGGAERAWQVGAVILIK